MPLHDPASALAAGTTVVTPNKRLARALVAKHDAAMLSAGKRAWSAVRALPWPVWVTALWREALEQGVAPPATRLLSEGEARYLWMRVVREDAAVAHGLLDVAGAADSAYEAWSLAHAWGSGGEIWRAWRNESDESDAAAFARWAERYRRELARLSAVDLAMLPDAIREWAPRVTTWRRHEVMLAGFVELSSQQKRLHQSLIAAGMDLVEGAPRAKPARRHRASGETPREELRAALEWARERAARSPEGVVGIAVVDLVAVRDQVRALADDILCPALQLPGSEAVARPYSVSIGAPLSDHPMAACALGLIALAHGTLPRADAAALARSQHFAGDWVSRAGAERAWIEDGRAELSWSEFAESMPGGVATRLAAARESVTRDAQPPATWAAQWRTLLERCGWPGPAPLSEPAHEARQAWERLVDAFAQIGHVETRMGAFEAPAVLRGMARRTLWEPEPARTPIAIMGLSEAAALDFDALWVSGLSAQRWPPAPQPNPMLPLAWQRERDVPRSSAARELGFARLVTDRLAANADDVVMSAPEAIDDFPSAPSALLDAAWPRLRPQPPAATTAQRIALARSVEAIVDDRAPPFALPAAPGGAGTIAAQSTCPFQAMARTRLRVEPWPGGFAALSYRERGQLVHATMAAFWSETRTHAALAALDRAALDARVAKAARAARETIPPPRWRRLPAAVAHAEVHRIEKIAVEWLDRFERTRPAFTVTQIEEAALVSLAGLTFKVRLDRVDALDGGGVAIIDYKTGAVDGVGSWFDMRPSSPQLGVYALALLERDPATSVRALAYARLKAGEIGVVGIAADAASWKDLRGADKLPHPQGWAAIEAWWRTRLPEIAAEFRDGVASVTPSDPPACCRKCNLHPLCRIDEARLARDSAA